MMAEAAASEIRGMLVEFDIPLLDAIDLVEAAWMATAELEEERDKKALRAVLHSVKVTLVAIQKLWKETFELAGGKP
jgi:hypothetical protein